MVAERGLGVLVVAMAVSPVAVAVAVVVAVAVAGSPVAASPPLSFERHVATTVGISGLLLKRVQGHLGQINASTSSYCREE